MNAGSSIRRIGVWNTAFLGDAVLALPLLAALRRRYPEAELEFWVRSGLEPLFTAQPGLTSVHGFAKRGSQAGARAILTLARQLRAKRFDLWISCHRSLRSGLIAWLAHAPLRIGYDRPLSNRFWYTCVVRREFGQLDEIARLLRLLDPLGQAQEDEWPHLVLPKQAHEKASTVLADWGNDPVLGVHPGSTWPTKRWPAGHFSRLIDLALEQGTRVLLFAGRDEIALARAVTAGSRLWAKAKAAGQARNTAGTLDLPTLAACLGRLDAYLCNDSGPMHLAWVQHVPLVALFGPTVPGQGFAPRGGRARVLETELPCRPCGLHGGRRCRRGDLACLAKITPERAWTALAPWLKTKAP